MVRDGLGRMIGKTTPSGHWSFEYDGASNLVATTDPLGQVSRSTFDGDGRVLTRTDPFGRTTTQQYDASGYPTDRIDATGAVWREERSGLGRLLSTTGPSGVQVSYGFDRAGNVATETTGAGSTHRTFSYDGLVEYETDRRGATTYYGYTDGQLVYQQINAVGLSSAVQINHDQGGRVTAVVDPLGTSVTSATTRRVASRRSPMRTAERKRSRTTRSGGWRRRSTRGGCRSITPTTRPGDARARIVTSRTGR